MFCNGKLSKFLNINIGVPQGSVLGTFLFLLFINDVTNFTAVGNTCNLFSDDNILYASGKTVNDVKSKLQMCIDTISIWYNRNHLKINIDKSKIMLIGTKSQLRNLNLDDFVITFDQTPLEIVDKAKYLGIFISSDLSWDTQVSHLCRQMGYYLSLLRRLRKIFPRELLIKIYKTFVQPKLDYGITIWGCTTEANVNKVQTILNFAARIITGNFDYINVRGIDLVKSLKLHTERLFSLYVDIQGYTW